MKTLAIGLGRRGGDIAAETAEIAGPGLRILYADTDADDLRLRPKEARLRLSVVATGQLGRPAAGLDEIWTPGPSG